MHVVCYIQGDSTQVFDASKNHLLGILYSEGEKVHYANTMANNKNYVRAERFRITENLLKVTLNGPHFDGWN
jgi:hypothetical protein